MTEGDVGRWILQWVKEPEFRAWLSELAVRMVGVDTSIGRDVDRMRRNEAVVLGMIEEAARGVVGDSASVGRAPMLPQVADHPFYTIPYYAGDLGNAVYEERFNVTARWSGRQGGPRVAVNAHVDTVAPFFGPSLEGGTLRGRGAVDDKGGCVAMLGALRLLRELEEEGVRPQAGEIEFQFVIDEEMGGNGSLSLALGAARPFDVVAVIEPTGFQVYPANRGAVWYRVAFDTLGSAGLSVAEMALAAVRAIEEEGRRIREESEHPLFPDRPTPTCQGMLGPFGVHPSSVCDFVGLVVRGEKEHATGERVSGAIERGLAEYCTMYGNKTEKTDGTPRRAAVDTHVEIHDAGETVRVDVFGKSGHMGRVAECDDAIVKAAFIAAAMPDDLRVGLQGMTGDARTLALEGGQGFLPTHALTDVSERVAAAAERGARDLVARRSGRYDDAMVTATFDKLHNEAFACNPEADGVRAMVEAMERMGVEVDRPLRGFVSSCDARIFAHRFPGSTVFTFGPGSIAHAHGDDEQVELGDVALAAGALCGFCMRVQGAVS